MKSNLKKLAALLLTAMLVLSLFSTVSFAAGTGRREKLAQNQNTSKFGYIPFQQVGGKATTEAYLRGDAAETNATRDPLPSKYDSRDYGYLPPVRNQNPYGTCWTFAAMASVEAYMIKNGVINGATGQPANANINLAEYHLAWFNYTSAYDKLGMLTGDSSTPVGKNFLDIGGNGAMATYTLMRWAGAASETTAALEYSKASTSGLNSQYAYNYDVAHVSDVSWVPLSNRDTVKRMLMEYGACGISYYHAENYVNYGDTTAYCYKQTAQPGYTGYTYGNHAVTLVGWDDNYSKNNFKSSYGPSSNGAWIIRNSWGTSWGDDGYFYLSYEDSASYNETAYFYKAEAVDQYDSCYQYDGSCNVTSYKSLNNNAQVANVFTANGSESLTAVSVAPWDEAVTYTVQVYKNLTSSTNPTSGTLVSSQNGYFEFSGYHTVELNTPVSLSAGDTFAVVFTMSTPTPDSGDGKYIHMPYDATASISWAKWTHANHGNTSFYREANGSWYDTPNNGDFRIKAYTLDASYTVTAVSSNTSYGTVSVRGTKITASPANGYYVSDVQVTSGTATYTLSGNTIVVTPSSNCTVKVTFAKKPLLTVNYIARGSSVGSQSAYIYDVINLPATVSNVPSGWNFVGWSATQMNETANKPAFYAPGAEFTVTANTTLYALYTRIVTTSEIIYEIVADPVTDWTGKYVITYGKDSDMLILKGISGNNSYESSTIGGAATLSASGMTLNNTILKNAANAYVFEVASTGSGWSIKNVSTGTYLANYTSTLTSRTDYASSYCNWALEYDTYNICMKVSNSASASYPYLVKGSNSYFVVNSNFTTYKTQFWKQKNAYTTYYNTNPGGTTHTHSYGTWTSNSNGTHSRTCSCGDKQTANCTYRDVVTAPTTTSQGYTTHTCTVCGYSYKDSYTDPVVPTTYYTVTFSVPSGVSSISSQTVSANSTITLPTAGAPTGYTFKGWVTSAVSDTTTMPSYLTGSYKVTGNVTLRALYAYTTTSGGSGVSGYQLVTSAPSSWAGNYVITYGTASSSMYLLKGVTPSSNGAKIESSANAASFANSGASLSNNVLTNVANNYVFTLAAHGSYYSVQNVSTGTYLGLTSSAYLGAYTTYTSTYCDWTPGVGTNASSMKSAKSGSYPYLSFTTGSKYFWSGSSVNTSVRLWKQTSGGSSTTYYTTSPTTNTHTHSYGAWTSNNNGTHSRTCSCGDKQTANCTYRDVVTAPTTTSQGYTTHTCTVCGYSYKDSYTNPIDNTTYYTVTFSTPSGVTAPASQTVAANSYVTLPTASAPSGYTFKGWVTSAVSNTTTMPSYLTGSYKVTGNITLRALYSYTSTSGGSGTTYTLVGSTPSSWAGDYIITYGTNTSSLYVLKGLSGNTSYESASCGGAVLLSNTGMTYSNGTLTGATAPYVFKVAADGSYYTIQNSSTGTYLGIYNYYLYSRSSYSSSYCRWTLSCSSNNVTVKNAAGGNYPYLSFYTNSKYFMSSSTVPTGLYFWRQTTTGGTSTTYYTTG